MQGVIKTFVSEKKYGFIKGDDEKDYFFFLDAFEEHHKDKICDDALVEFEPTATPKGYKAIKCILLDPLEIMSYAVPDDFPTSKAATIKGWDIIEMGDWVIQASSSNSPDDAKNILIDRARSIKANAVVNLEYFKTTGSERGTGDGTYYFTIHNYQGRVAVIARKNRAGKYCGNDLRGLNQRAEALKQQLVELTKQSKEVRGKVSAVVVGLSISVLLGMMLIGVGGAIVGIIIIAITVFLITKINSVTEHDHWLLPIPFKA